MPINFSGYTNSVNVNTSKKEKMDKEYEHYDIENREIKHHDIENLEKNDTTTLFAKNTQALEEKLNSLNTAMCDSVVCECDELISENMKIACFRKESIKSVHHFMSLYEKYRLLTHSIARNRDILQISADVEQVGIINDYIAHFTGTQGNMADNICMNMDTGRVHAKDADYELDRALSRKKRKNKIIKFICGVIMAIVCLVTLKNLVWKMIFS